MEKTSFKSKIKEICTKEITKKDITEFLKNNLLTIYIILNICYVTIGSFCVKTYRIFSIDYARGYIYLFVANIFVIIALLIRRYKKKITDLFIVLIGIFAIISTIFAVDQSMALYGVYGRFEGLFTIFYYLTIMFLSSYIPEKKKKLVIYIILATGAIQAIYGIFQSYGLVFAEKGIHSSATGFITNPNFFSTFMLLNLSYSMGLFIDEDKTHKKVIFILLNILFTTGLLFSNTSSGIVGLGAVLVYSFIYCLKNKSIKKFIAILAIIICTVIATDKMGKTSVVKDTITVTQEATEVAKGNVNDSFGSSRMYIWKETMKILPNCLLHGVGVDNFSCAFNNDVLWSPNHRVMYDKAHNEYLQTLVTQGIFSLISYLCLYFIIVKNGIKNSLKNKETLYILPILGYLVQAFFNISVIEVAPIFYIALGLANNIEN